MRTRWLAVFIAFALRALSRTWRVRAAPLPGAPYVLAILHGEMLPVIGIYRGLPITMMSSLSADGELAAQVLRRLGLGVARGSASVRGREALGDLEAAIRAGGVALIAVDGSRGPRGVVKAGALVLARRASSPLVALRVSAEPAFTLRSWDRFCIPLPFARVHADARVLDPSGEDFDAALSALQSALKVPAGSPAPDPLT